MCATLCWVLSFLKKEEINLFVLPQITGYEYNVAFCLLFFSLSLCSLFFRRFLSSLIINAAKNVTRRKNTKCICAKVYYTAGFLYFFSLSFFLWVKTLIVIIVVAVCVWRSDVGSVYKSVIRNGKHHFYLSGSAVPNPPSMSRYSFYWCVVSVVSSHVKHVSIHMDMTSTQRSQL